MGATPTCTVDATGIHRPTLAECLAYFTYGYAAIYGSDVVLSSDTEDGEFLGLLGAAVDDCNAMAVDTFNAYSPATAQGTGLSSVVKINGLERAVPSNSSVPVLIVGVATTTITGGVFNDPAGNAWLLPQTVTIPTPTAQIAVTATCLALGAIQLASGLTSGSPSGLTIVNPTQGWQSVTTTSAATAGAPVEGDPQLRIRQGQSTQIPASTMLGGIVGALWALPGVARLRAYQNETDAPDSNGVPGYSVAIVIEGGGATQVAATISQYKFAAGTYGTTSESVVDNVGISHTINFFYATIIPITIGVTLTPGPTYSTNTNALIQQSMAAWVNSLGIGCQSTSPNTQIPGSIQLSRSWNAAYLAPLISAAAAALQAAVASGDQGAIAAATATFTAVNLASNTYEVTAITLARNGGTLTAADVAVAFNEDPNIAVDASGNLVNPASVVVTI